MTPSEGKNVSLGGNCQSPLQELLIPQEGKEDWP